MGQENNSWTIYPPKKAENNVAEKENATSLTGQQKGKQIIIVEDYRLKDLLAKEVYIKEKKGTIDGFRIQLFYGSGADSRKKALNIQSNFIAKYPDVPSYLLYHAPNFKIRVGDFRSRIEAEKFLREIKSEFESVFIVKDEITMPEIKLE